MSEDDRQRYEVILSKAERTFLDYVVYKYQAESRASAVRVCIKAMAIHLGYPLDNNESTT